MTSTPSRPGSAAPARHATFRLVLAAVLVLVTLVALAVVGWRLTVARGDDMREEARAAVMSRSEEFMVRMGTYGPDLLDEAGAMPEYRETVREVITPKLAASFDKEAGAAEQLVAQAGVARRAEVFSSGVASIDDDSARVLVAGAFHDTYTVKGKEVGQEPAPFRVEVSLVLTEGEWLVDDFTPVTSEPAGGEGEQ